MKTSTLWVACGVLGVVFAATQSWLVLAPVGLGVWAMVRGCDEDE